MENCKEELKKWSRRTLKRADKEIHKLKEELKKLQESDLTQEKQEKIQQDRKGIMRHIEERFDALFTSSNNRNCEPALRNIPGRVTEDMNRKLISEVTEDEVRKAVFSMGSLKAPGLDGLNGMFYQKHWEIIKKEVCAVVKEIFQNGFLPEEIGETIVVLIPKVKDPEELNQLRPISCCNFIYKIITRVIVLRLKGFLKDIVSPTQSAFVGGRLIQDNVVIAQEVYHSLNKKGREGSQNIAIKLDMNKAYDRLEWDFLEMVLRKFGFAEKWIDLVMKCVRSASYRIKVNGELSKKIKPQRGLRQGDPLSPYLFILAAEVFTTLMQEARTKGKITGLKIAPTAPTLTHLLFADDCIIFAKAKEEEIFQIITVLNEYTEASGQRINMNKSGISFESQVPIQTRVDIEEILGMTTWDTPGKYLGLPAIWGRSQNKALAWIEEKIMNKLEGWKERLLNQAGKEILIKAVIQAMPSYIMNVIKLPKSFCRRICAKVARFWWAASGKERAYLAKQAWRVLKNPNAIWVQTLKSIYFPDGNFWTASGKKGASWIWRSLLQGRELLKESAKWSIGNGSKVRIWKDNWIVGRSGPLNSNSTDDSRVKDLIANGEGWNKRKIESMFSQDICKEILSTPVSVMNKEDHLYWPWREDENYSIRTGYYASRRIGQNWKHENPSTSEDKREIWKEEVNPRWTICRATALEATYCKQVEKQQTHKTEIIRWKTNLVKWRPPPENWLKANVDAAFKKDTGTGAIAVVIRNHRGRIMLGFSGKIQARSSIMAEAQAIRQALIIVNNLQMGRILIESDNLKLVQAIKSKTDLGEALAIIQDIRILMETSPEKGVTWTPRNGNRLAHAVAKAAEAETLPGSHSANHGLRYKEDGMMELGQAMMEGHVDEAWLILRSSLLWWTPLWRVVVGAPIGPSGLPHGESIEEKTGFITPLSDWVAFKLADAVYLEHATVPFHEWVSWIFPRLYLLLSIHYDGEIVYDEKGSIVFRSGQPIITYMTPEVNNLTSSKNLILHSVGQQEYEVNPDDGDDADEEPPKIPDDGEEEEEINYYDDIQIALIQPVISRPYDWPDHFTRLNLEAMTFDWSFTQESPEQDQSNEL
ncbi:uncharacterized protein [Arachis hypogaea]|uniref:uncharacterized protein n=1 Tax=Arachis hypogaea TaxID=3818 RepID=UPI003B2118B2